MNKALLLLSLLLLPAVQALEISNYESTVEITNMSTKERITLTVLNPDTVAVEEINYPFSGQIKNINVSDSRGEIPTSLEYKGNNLLVKAFLREPLGKDESITLGYLIETGEALTKKEDTYILSRSHSLLANVENFRMNIVLPEGYGVTGEGVSPRPTRINSDGRRIILVWEYSLITTELRDFKVLLLFEKIIKEPPVIVEKTVEMPVIVSVRSVFPYIVILVLTVLLIPLAARYMREEGITIADYFDRSKYAENKIDILKEDEQSILKLVIEKDGIDQREIQRITDFSKTKVSKILAELEKRGAITKQQTGRRNKIYLSGKMKEGL